MNKNRIGKIKKEVKSIDNLLEHYNRKMILDGTVSEFLVELGRKVDILITEESAEYEAMSEKDKESEAGDESFEYIELLKEAKVIIDETLSSMGEDYHMDDLRMDIEDIACALEEIYMTE